MGPARAARLVRRATEGGLEIVRHTLLALDYPMGQVQPYIDAVRRDAYDITVMSPDEQRTLDQLIATVRGMEIAWRRVPPGSRLIGQTLAETNLRARTSASIVAIVREGVVLPNPKSSTRFANGDLIGLIGDPDQIVEAENVIAAGTGAEPPGEQREALEPGEVPAQNTAAA